MYSTPPAAEEQPRIRLVATDLDGTLLDRAGFVSKRTESALRSALEAGIHVIPVTGRPPQAMFPVLDGLGLGPYGVCSNGAVTVDMTTTAVVEEQSLPHEIATGLVRRIREAIPGILFATDNLDCFSYEAGFFSKPNDWDEYVSEVGDILHALDRACLKVVCRLPGVAPLELISLLEEHVGEEGHVTSSGLDWVDIGAAGISKAYALEKVCERLGIAVSEVVAVGDNHNDVSVLAWAGLAMATANAVPEVLAMVDRVLPAHHEDGVAVFLEELVSVEP